MLRLRWVTHFTTNGQHFHPLNRRKTWLTANWTSSTLMLNLSLWVNVAMESFGMLFNGESSIKSLTRWITAAASGIVCCFDLCYLTWNLITECCVGRVEKISSERKCFKNKASVGKIILMDKTFTHEIVVKASNYPWNDSPFLLFPALLNIYFPTSNSVRITTRIEF